MKKININEYIKVKLNDKGRKILYDQYLHYRKHVTGLKFKEPQEDSEGYSKWQLWHFMQTFGPEIALGNDLPFDADILIEWDN